MNEPMEIMHRIRLRRAHAPDRPRSPAHPAPTVPAPAPAAPAAQTPHPDPPEAPARPVSRRPGGHGLYSQVMRSHDRMGTRHLNRPGS